MRIGILGGGQLAMMMIEMSSKNNKLDFLVVDPGENPPASKFIKCIKSEYNNKTSLDLLIKECDVVTIDFENVPAGALKYIEQHIPVYPNSKAVEICQDRLFEKNLFVQNQIKTTNFEAIESEEDLIKAIDKIGTNSILKSRTLGYDGKNQIEINNQSPKKVWKSCGEVKSILENKINFSTELSLIGVRTISGETFFYPLVENYHKNGILNVSVAPYEDIKLQKDAETIHNKITNELKYVGVLVIEFFLDENRQLIANEMAPRVHNSGHWTISGANISQFEAHILAIANMEIKPISINNNSAMLNILSKMPNKDIIEKNGPLQFYDYGKSERKNRKLGHLTITNPDRSALMDKVKKISKIIFQ